MRNFTRKIIEGDRFTSRAMERVPWAPNEHKRDLHDSES
jgi:hypothetical protein